MNLTEYITTVLSAANGINAESITFEVYINERILVTPDASNKLTFTIDIYEKSKESR